ncbi:hypothetical protein [Fibrobacter sp.]|uniref:hypothetical protein n=1 Tax=Fibrobacter sp. TaxID=35828 RepID=UPI00388E8227
MNELPCPYCGFTCEIPSNKEEKIECPNCGSIFLYIQNSESHGTIDYRPSPKMNDRGRQMNELKAFDITVAEEGYCDDIVKYRLAVYDKNETDKLIADKDTEIRRLKRALYKVCANWMINRQLAMMCYHLEARAKKFDKAIAKCQAKAEECK